MAITERTHNLVMRVSDEELAKLKQLADEEGGAAMAVLVRRWLATAWEKKHGERKPKRTTK